MSRALVHVKAQRIQREKGVCIALSGLKRIQSIQCLEMRRMYLYLPVQFCSSSLNELMLEQRDTTGTFVTVPIEK